MLTLVILLFLIWITTTLVATWIHAIRTQEAPLVGPLLRVSRLKHPIGYWLSMGALLAPTLLVLGVTMKGLIEAFPRQFLPTLNSSDEHGPVLRFGWIDAGQDRPAPSVTLARYGLGPEIVHRPEDRNPKYAHRDTECFKELDQPACWRRNWLTGLNSLGEAQLSAGPGVALR